MINPERLEGNMKENKNEMEEIVKKRLKGMSVRILACLEHALSSDLENVSDDEQFLLRGSDLKIIRSEILNASGDTTRSLGALLRDGISNKLSISRDMIVAFNKAEVDFLDEDIPFFMVSGDLDLLYKIRDKIGSGLVYNNMYASVGIDTIVDHIIPFLDQVQLAGIKIADGNYKEWRNQVCRHYLEGLVND